jgi:hypothetical protein
MLHIKMAPGEEEDAWVVLWRLQNGKVAVVHTSADHSGENVIKGASPNLTSAATEEGSRGIKDKLSMTTS